MKKETTVRLRLADGSLRKVSARWWKRFLSRLSLLEGYREYWEKLYRDPNEPIHDVNAYTDLAYGPRLATLKFYEGSR